MRPICPRSSASASARRCREGIARGQCFGRTGRELFIAPLAQLPRAEAKLGGDIRQRLAAVEEMLNGLRLELTSKPSPGPLLRHAILLGSSGSLQNPPLPRGKSTPALAVGSVTAYWTKHPDAETSL